MSAAVMVDIDVARDGSILITCGPDRLLGSAVARADGFEVRTDRGHRIEQASNLYAAGHLFARFHGFRSSRVEIHDPHHRGGCPMTTPPEYEVTTTTGLGRDWHHAAACTSSDPEIFYPLDTGPDGPARIAKAKRVCAKCPVRAVCLTDAMAREDPARRWGVVGGTSPQERGELFARRRTRGGEAA